MKRIIACLLFICLLFSLLPVQVMAADETVSAELVLENSGLKTAEGRMMYKLHFRLFGKNLGNVAMAYLAIDSNVFDIGMLSGTTPAVSTLNPTTSGVALPTGHCQFRAADGWINGYTGAADTGSSAVSMSGTTYYVRLEADRGLNAPLPYSDYMSESYTAEAPSIGTMYLIIKTGKTATADAVRFVSSAEAEGFNAPAAIFAANSGGDFFLHNAVPGVSGNAMTAATVRLVEQASKLEVVNDSAYRIDNTTGYLTGVKAQTTMTTLIAQFKNSADTLKVFDKNGGEITDPTAKLGTGTVLKLMNGSVEVQSVTIVVKGDVNGDANVTADDVTLLFRAVLRLETLDGAYAEAGRVLGGRQSSADDVTYLFRYILRLESEL